MPLKDNQTVLERCLSLIVYSHMSNFLSYLVAVTITSYRAANVDISIALVAI
jgi:hypothetical protein